MHSRADGNAHSSATSLELQTDLLAFWLILCAAARMARTFPMDKKPVNLAVLFADITGSTRLYEKLGNARALECVGLCLNIMRESALGCGGRVVQTIGDEVLCVFPTALAATQAATEMQSRVEMQEPVSGQRLQIHVGLQFGPVLEEGQDVFGDCVNVAARMVKLAKPSQIIAGGECVEALTGPMKDRTRALDKLPVKGREQEVDVYEVLWRQSEEVLLRGRGSISFGHPYSADPTEVAAFEIQTPT